MEILIKILSKIFNSPLTSIIITMIIGSMIFEKGLSLFQKRPFSWKIVQSVLLMAIGIQTMIGRINFNITWDPKEALSKTESQPTSHVAHSSIKNVK